MEKKRLKVYVSLPITGRRLSDARQHADMVRAALSRKGHDVVTPFDVYHGENPVYEDYLCNDLRVMLGCDAVCFCDGWEQSCGCNIEHDTAMRFKAHGRKDLKIMYES